MFPKQNDQLQVMSHAIVGFPSLDENESAIDGLVASGVKMIELQVPFSDPVADGHTIANACHEALKTGGSVRETLKLCKTVSDKHPDATFILMSYLNPLYRYGLEQLFRDAAAAGFKGMIIPDMPVEEFEQFMPLLDELGLAPILLVTPNTSDERVARIAKCARGMVYVVSRMGVTGKQTQWGEDFKAYVKRIRSHTDLPLSIGFGVRAADDLKALTGIAEVAAFCSRYIEWQRDLGSDVAAGNMKQLLSDADLA